MTDEKTTRGRRGNSGGTEKGRTVDDGVVGVVDDEHSFLFSDPGSDGSRVGETSMTDEGRRNERGEEVSDATRRRARLSAGVNSSHSYELPKPSTRRGLLPLAPSTINTTNERP